MEIDTPGATLNCVITHPKINPELISTELRLDPYLIQIAGKRIVTPKGNKLTGKYNQSKWALKIDIDGQHIAHEHLSALIDKLVQHEKFIKNLVNEGGSISIFINIPGSTNFAFSADAPTMQKLFNLKAQFGFEVFE